MWYWMVTSALAATTTVSLPSDEPAEPWHDAFALAGVELVSSNARARLTSRGAQWRLCVRRPDGDQCTDVARPRTPAEREEIAWLIPAMAEDLAFELPAFPAPQAPPVVAESESVSQPESESAPVTESDRAPVGVAAVPVPPPRSPPRPPSKAANGVARAEGERATTPPKPAVMASPVAVSPAAPAVARVPTPVATTTPPPPPPRAPVDEPVAPGTPVAAASSASPETASVEPSTAPSAPSAPVATAPQPPPMSDPSAAEPPPSTNPPPLADPPPASLDPLGRRIQQTATLGGRWQRLEGSTLLLGGGAAVGGPTWLGGVAAEVDAPQTLYGDSSRRTWTACTEVQGFWFPRSVGLGMGLGLEHQRWWQDGELVSAGWRPQLTARALWCPDGEGPICGSLAVGHSLRAVQEYEGQTALESGASVHVSGGITLRGVRRPSSP